MQVSLRSFCAELRKVDMNKIEFLVKGSASEPYKVVFQKTDQGLIAACDCSAAMNGSFCKHRTQIMQGSESGIVSKNKNEVATVASWFKGSDLEAKMKLIEQKETQTERLKKEVTQLKKELSKLMRTAA